MKQTSLFPDPAAERRATHTCHARGCTTHVQPEMLMCKTHWWLVPRKIRDAVWATYRHGQCDDMKPSREWLQAADAAIGFIARLEGKLVTKTEKEALEAFK
jgi:hypothetical protein